MRDPRVRGAFASLFEALAPGGRGAGSLAFAGLPPRSEVSDRQRSAQDARPRMARPQDSGPGQAREAPVPFQPPPPALLAQPSSGSPAPAGAPGHAQAEIASLVERFVTSFRLGRVGRGGTEVRMRLAIRGDVGVTARLRLDDGELTAVLVAEPGADREAEHLAAALEDGLRARGLRVAGVRVEPA